MIELSATPRVSHLNKQGFLTQYKHQQQPVILENITAGWPARDKWNLDYIKKLAGDHIVPLYDSKPSAGRKLQHAAETKMPLRDYIKLLEKGEKGP